MAGSRLSIAVVSGAIAPYSNRLYNAVAGAYDLDLHVFTCVETEPQRKWRVDPAIAYTLKTLPGLRYHIDDMRNVYFNPSILAHLQHLRPSAIILGSFSPTMMMAAAYAFATSTPLGISTDGAIETDPGNSSLVHRWVRKSLVPRASFGIGASQASVDLLTRYGLAADRCHIVPLIPAWGPPPVIPGYAERPFDVLFCGSVNENRKGALFFADVLIRCKSLGRTLRARISGDGPDRVELEARLKEHGIPAQFDGYLQPAQLASAFLSSKLFLFPSRADPWGLVANEAVLCGTPIVCSPHAISSIEMVDRFDVGRMVPLEAEAWSTTVLELLGDTDVWTALQRNRERAIPSFSLEHAVQSYAAIIDEVRNRTTRNASRVA